ncbi:hypothetical protein FRB96_005417 [Tulasnella sp. 330]|nr:hypothetical protein FRB96_005417 [Tulasnella sp. 330]
MPSSNQKFQGFDAAFDSFKSAFTVPILEGQHLVFIGAANQFVRTSLSSKDASSRASPIAVTNEMTGFDGASPELRLLSSKAIHRLELWIDALVSSEHHQGGELPLPPLDVLIMLNAYMLSPRPFLEDVRVRDLPQLRTFPIKDIAARIQNGEYQPTKPDLDSWMQMVKVPFDVAQMPDAVDIHCPRCTKCLIVKWEEANGNGYGQAGFKTTCPSCPKLVVNHDALCAGKFLTDLSTCQRDHKRVLMGTLLDQKGVRDDIKAGRVIVDEVVKILGKSPRNDLGDELSWSMDAILSRLKTSKNPRFQTNVVNDQFRSYLNSSPFTADLVEKTFSYMDFSEAFRKDGWFDGSKEEASKVKALTTAIKDFRAFIRIVRETNEMGFVSHELDVVWHAHQLIGPQKYRCAEVHARGAKRQISNPTPTSTRSQTVELTGGLLDHLSISLFPDTQETFDDARLSFLETHGLSRISCAPATCITDGIRTTTMSSPAGPAAAGPPALTKAANMDARSTPQMKHPPLLQSISREQVQAKEYECRQETSGLEFGPGHTDVSGD